MSKNNLLKFATALLPLLAVLLAWHGVAWAADVTLTPPIQNSSGGGAGIQDIIGKVTGVIFWLAITICPICIIWGGFEIATAGGDPTKTNKGKQIIYYSIGGLVLIALSSVLVAVIKTVL
jgi:Type IV secretion system pilin